MDLVTVTACKASPKLIERFKEREENVKMDVFNAFTELLLQTGNVTKGQIDINEQRFLSHKRNIVLPHVLISGKCQLVPSLSQKRFSQEL